MSKKADSLYTTIIFPPNNMLYEALTALKGIGPKRAERFAELGLFSIRDLLYFVPRRHLDFSQIKNISEIQHGEYAAVSIEFIGPARQFRTSNRLLITSVSIGDSTGNMQAVWYNQPYMYKLIPKNSGGFILGRMDRRVGIKFINAVFARELPGILPVYPSVKGLNQNIIRNTVKEALKAALPLNDDIFEKDFRDKYGLAEISQALCALHFPKDIESLQKAEYTLSFESFVLFTIVLEILRRRRKNEAGIIFNTEGLFERFVSLLPFEPTNAQKNAMKEIADDMNKKQPMNRLLQGDVGSGKTIVALYAMYIAAQNGFQAVLMAPTELLAAQHYTALKKIFGSCCALLTGNMKKKEKDSILRGIADGSFSAVTGTHALLENNVKFKNPGLVISDEQHRFGVHQRAMLEQKGVSPDVLIMSATPIPRTLSLMLYGDLDISVLNEMPPGRKPVETDFVPGKKRIAMYRYIEDQIKTEKIQAYVVCPFIEDSDEFEKALSAESVFSDLKNNLDIKIALLHGRMKADEKEMIMKKFREGEIDMLVSTTVIEVGVDVPNACIMVVESAERFGLAELHQLRGRVGRGERKSYCFLLSSSLSETSKERLKTLVSTNDGFKIAEKDLETRGAGEFLGTRQHGISQLGEAALSADTETLIKARDAAVRILNDDSENSERIVAAARSKYKTMLDTVTIN